LQETTDRAELLESYRRASAAVRSKNASEMADLDALSDEGLG
jgi:hypothetical protein